MAWTLRSWNQWNMEKKFHKREHDLLYKSFQMNEYICSLYVKDCILRTHIWKYENETCDDCTLKKKETSTTKCFEKWII